MAVSKTPAGTKPTASKPMAKPAPSGATKRNAEFSCDHMLDDAAIIGDVLATQKTLVKAYGVALCEGSNEKFRNLCNTHLSELASDQFDSFLYMNQRNLYPTDPAPAPKLSEAKQRYKATQVKMKSK